MTRFGKLLLGIGVLLLLALATMVRFGDLPGVSPAGTAAQRDAGATAPGFAGRLLVPVAGVRPDQLVDTFGDPRGEGGARGHGAIDIMAPRGTPVIAAAPGVIEKLFDSAAGGHTLYIRVDGGRWQHYYAHLDRYAANVREGLRVARGQIIAAVGSTGDANPEAPHLHFAVNRMAPADRWWQGRAVDPLPLLAGTPPAR